MAACSCSATPTATRSNARSRPAKFISGRARSNACGARGKAPATYSRWSRSPWIAIATPCWRRRCPGPTCHRGTPSCFDGDARAHPWLNELETLIAARANGDPASSYVATLLAATPAGRAQKVGEEGVEVALAAATGDIDGIRSEAADLLFHLLVLLRGAGLPFADVVGELAQRHRDRD